MSELEPPDTLRSEPELPHADDPDHDGLDTGELRARARAKLFGGSPEPTRIGRHLVIGRIGAGGMGVVYSAFDPELDRRVAIKLLRSGSGGSEGRAEHRERLAREAQALARLSHPNVVQVYDVGTHGEQLYISMEYIDGQNLREWMRSEPRPPMREGVEVFVRAGRGLWAAHQAGLVHRDFKPHNVLVGKDGRILVADFGLARGREAQELVSTGSSSDRLDQPLTRTGAIVGTPAYMAPEQLAGGASNELCDQFSFCVSLFEWLYERTPFPAHNLAELEHAIARGPVFPRTETVVPSRVRKVVVRGLSVEPSERFPSMKHLLEALDRDRRRLRTRTVAAAAGIGVVGGAAVVMTMADAEPCSRGTELASWNSAQRKAIAQAFVATKRGYAEDAYARIVDRLDRYSEQWAAQRIEACEDTRVHAKVSEELLDLRVACLDRARTAFEALLSPLERIDADSVEQAIQSVGALPPVQRCADLEYVQARVPPPSDPAIASRVETLSAEVAKVRAMTRLVQFEAARQLVESVVAEAQTLQYRPLIAESLEQLGTVEQRTGRHEEAIAAYERAFFVARAGGADEVAFRSAQRLIDILAFQQLALKDARRWSRHAAAELDRIGRGRREEADHLASLGGLSGMEGNYDEALRLHSEALAVLESVPDVEGEDLGYFVMEIGVDHDGLGEHQEALTFYRRALDLIADELGPGHPGLLPVLGNMALAHGDAGDHPTALEYSRRALDLARQALGPDHPRVGTAELNYAVALEANGDLPGTNAALERALRITTQVRGTRHADTALVLSNIGATKALLGEPEAGLPFLERAIAIATSLLGDGHPDVARYRVHAANALMAAERFAEAYAELESAIAVLETSLGADHPVLGTAYRYLATLYYETQRYDEAVAAAERAVAVRTGEGLDPRELAQAQSLLANTLWMANGDRDRAIELKRTAVAQYRKTPSLATKLTEAEAVLASWEAARPD